jgi:hypothetical protein
MKQSLLSFKKKKISHHQCVRIFFSPKKKKIIEMLRRVGLFQQQQQQRKLVAQKSSTNFSSVVLVAAPHATTATRTYVGPLDPFFSLFMCGWVGCTFAAWGNNLFSVGKFGLYRNHQMQLDGSILPEYNRTAQFLGACFGVCFYWFIVGPMKYRHSDMEKWSKRVGPF